ncbi:MAG: suppressor of fused domain protein [Coriobacteriia bacterium]|nr:suppressor of fused domain protein [Coriobacteriia bacterium]
MNLEQFKKKAAEVYDWAPGWEAIDACLDPLYPGQEPRHFGAPMSDRAIFGGDQYLDGFSVYQSPHGHLHIVTYGMSELYINEESLGGEWSKWGYEMTIRLPLCEEKEYLWAIDLLANLARYTFEQQAYYEPLQFIGGDGSSICSGSGSSLTGLLIIKDPELPGTDTLYGRLDFMQLVGITEDEKAALKKDSSQALILFERMKQDNPFFITDLTREQGYL